MPILNVRGASFRGLINVVKATAATALYALTKKNSYSNSPTNSGDRFGACIAFADTTTAFVSGYLNTPTGGVSQAGNVFRYTYGSDWSQAQQLNLGGSGQTNSEFGWSIDASSEWLVVGSPSEDYSSKSDAGAVYIYRNVGGTWQSTYHTRLVSPVANASNRFGNSVAISGNYIIVGENNGDTPTTNTGNAYIYYWDGTSWTQQAQLDAGANATNGESFGYSVSIDGDTAVVGAYTESPAGAVYVFTRSGTTWSLQQRLLPSLATSGARFGASVKIRGNRLVIGSPYPTSTKGRIYYFTRSGTSWTQEALLTVDVSANNPNIVDSVANGAQLGNSVDVHPTLDVIIAGAPSAFTNTGRVYVFEKVNGVWTAASTSILNETGSSFNGYFVGFHGNNVVSGERRSTGTGKFYYYLKQ